MYSVHIESSRNENGDLNRIWFFVGTAVNGAAAAAIAAVTQPLLLVVFLLYISPHVSFMRFSM